MHLLENNNKRADFPNISENFRKIREQEREDIPKKFFRGAIHLINCYWSYNMNKI